tara:strand:- start:668 stop:1123 length:456 start_codon:yes stop_codon:yes gene_type:complete
MDELRGRKITLPSGSTAWWPCHISSDHIGTGCNIGALSHIGRDVELGNDCRIQGSVYIADKSCLGNRVFVGPGAVITNDRHPPSKGSWKPVHIGDDVVIGANSTIVAGVKLHSKCVIAAGSVVSTDVPAGEVWGGVPAKFMMTREDYEARR